MSSDVQRMVLTIPELQKALGIQRSKAYKLVHDGKIPTITIGRRRFVTVKTLETMLNGQQPATESK